MDVPISAQIGELRVSLEEQMERIQTKYLTGRGDSGQPTRTLAELATTTTASRYRRRDPHPSLLSCSKRPAFASLVRQPMAEPYFA